MLAYQIRLALKSIRRNPVLSLLLIGGIALGIAVAMTFVTGHYMMSGDPIPQKSSRLFYVQLDSWSPDAPWDDDDPTEPPDQLTYRDAMAVMASDIPTHKSAMYISNLTVLPEGDGNRPFREITRMCYADFFRMFDVPFRYGSAWDASMDEGPEAVVVLDQSLNQKLFGGEDSVGRSLRIEDREFRVVGVLDSWRPLIKYYDTHNGKMDSPESLYIPFAFGREMEIRTAGNSSGWKTWGSEYEDLLESEAIWIQAWVQLDDAVQKDEFMGYLAAYVADQKLLGRFERPLNNKLRSVMEWMHFVQVVPEEVVALLIIAMMFLLICSVNLIGILLGKFLARAPEVSIRRALGASRRWIFVQHLIECELIGVLGGVLGIVLSLAGLQMAGRLFEDPLLMTPDWNMLGVGIALALASALVAGIYPAWRICRVQPGNFLKSQ